MSMRKRFIISCLAVLAAAAGCRTGLQSRHAKLRPMSGTPIGLQLLEKDPALKGLPFNGLLHFETAGDAVFVAARPTPRVVTERAHTGRGALLLARGTRRAMVKVTAAAGRDLAGEWPLVGPYLLCDEEVSVTVAYDVRGGRRLLQRRITLPAGQWTSAALDISMLPNGGPGDGLLGVEFDAPLQSPVWVDDVLVVNNSQTLLDTGRNGWTIRRRGHRILIDRPLSFNLALTTAESSPQGWTVQEINPLRARFTSPGETETISVYYDGRTFWDGEFRGLSVRTRDDPTLAAAHNTPADASVPAELGKVDRDSDGDTNNDGYNETTGAYRVIASGSRVEVTLRPRSVPIPRPVLQIAGLPEGKVLITMDGQLIRQSTRLEGGDVLVELPTRVVRTTTISASVRED
jgi:hypothetical protein